MWMVAVARTVLTHNATGYRKGCRCDICRADMAEARRLWAATGARSYRPPVEVVDDQIGLAWKAKAACRDFPTDWWFHDHHKSDETKNAVAICNACPVRLTCLEWALQWPVHDLHGIWGGTSQRERIRIIDQRKAPTCQPTQITLRTTGRLSGNSLSNS